MQQNLEQIQCKFHKSENVEFICSLENCEHNFICKYCIQSNSNHAKNHYNHIYSLNDFMATNFNQKNQKIDDTLNLLLVQNILELEKKLKDCQNQQDLQLQKVEQDFNQLMNIFTKYQQQTKQEIIQKITGNFAQIIKKTQMVKRQLALNNENNKQSFFTSIFGDDNDDSLNQSELIMKIIKKNAKLNLIRADTIVVQKEFETFAKNKITYKASQDQINYFDEISNQFEQNCNAIQNDLQKLISNFNIESKNIMQKSDKVKVDFFPEIQNHLVQHTYQQLIPINQIIDDSQYKDQQIHVYKYQDGSFYQGNMLNGLKHGRGKLLFFDGALYDGYWKEDQSFGFGRIIRINGNYYEGQCVNFKAQGQGIFQTIDGYKYVGSWHDDKKHGYGEETFGSSIEIKGNFVGKFRVIKKDNLLEGQGQLKYPNRFVYSGEFKNGQMFGIGQIEYINGEIYQGQVKNGKKHGKGRFLFSNKNVYEGDFFNDLAEGKGTLKWPDGVMYRGEWKEGYQHGLGEQISANEIKKGEWKNGIFYKWI